MLLIQNSYHQSRVFNNHTLGTRWVFKKYTTWYKLHLWQIHKHIGYFHLYSKNAFSKKSNKQPQGLWMIFEDLQLLKIALTTKCPENGESQGKVSIMFHGYGFCLPLNGLVFKSNPIKLHIAIRNGHKNIKHRNNRLWTHDSKLQIHEHNTQQTIYSWT